MAVQVADLIATLRVDPTGYTTGMRAAEGQANATAGRISSSLSGVKIAFGAMGLAAAAAIGESVKQATQYQTLLTHIQSNTGMTNKEIAGMSDGIKQMASDTGAPLEQMAKGFMTIHNYGFSSADSMTILQKAMESALSTGDDVAAVSNVMGVAMHEFGLKASDAGAAMNVFHLAAQESNATLGQFAEGSTKATNMAATLGVSLVDVTAAVSTLVQSGQTVRAASDGITSTMMGIIKPTASATAAIASLSRETGVNLVADFSTAGLKSRGLAGVLGDVRLATQKLGGDTALQRKAMLDYANTLDAAGVTGDKFGQKMAAFGKSIHDPTAAVMGLFTNVRAFREVMLLTTTQADSFSKHLTDMAAAMSGKVDPTGKAFAAQQQTMAAQMAKLSETVQVLAINIGSVFLPILTSMLERVAPIVGAIGRWVQGHAQLTAVLLGGIAVLGTLTGGIAALSLVLGPVAAVIGALSLPIVGVVAAVALLATAWTHDWGGIREIAASVLSFLQPALQQLRDAITLVRIAFQLGGWSFALEEALVQVRQLWGNFTAWVSGTAFPALVSTFQREAPVVWRWLQQETPKVLTAAGQMLQALAGWLTGTYLPFLERFWGGAGKLLWSWIQAATPIVLNQLKIWAGQVAGWLGSTGIPALAAALGRGETALWNWIKAATPPALAQLGAWAGALGSWLKNTGLPTLGRLLAAGASALWGWIQHPALPTALRLIGEWLGKLGTWLKTDGLPALGRLLAAGASALWGWIQNPALPTALRTIGTLMTHLGAWLKTDGLPLLGRTLAAGASALWGWIQNPALPTVLREARALMTRFGSWLRTDGLPNLGRTLAAGASALWGWIKDPALPTALKEIGSLATKLGSWMRTDGLPTIGRTLAGVAHYLWDWIIDTAPQVLRTVAKWRDDLKGDLLLGLKGAKDWLLQAGKDLIQGLLNGMGSLKDAAKKKAGELAGDIKDAVTGFFGIKSPSTVFHQIGVDLIQGLINGIDSLIPSVTVAAGTLGTSIVTALTSGILSSSALVTDAATYLAEAPINAILTMFSMAADDGESKVWKQIGAMVPKSMAAGMTGGSGPLTTAAQATGREMVQTFLKELQAPGPNGPSREAENMGKSFVHSLGEGMGHELQHLMGEAQTVGKSMIMGIEVGAGKQLQMVNGEFNGMGKTIVQSMGEGVDGKQAEFVAKVTGTVHSGADAIAAQAPSYATAGSNLANALVSAFASTAQAGMATAIAGLGAGALTGNLGPTTAQTLAANPHGVTVIPGTTVVGGNANPLITGQTSNQASINPNQGAINASTAWWAQWGAQPGDWSRVPVAFGGTFTGAVTGSASVSTPATSNPTGTGWGWGSPSAPAGQVSGPVAPQSPGVVPGYTSGQFGVTVNLNAGAVTVDGGGQLGSLGQQIATAVTAAIRQVIGTQLTSAAGANSQLPGAL